MRLLYRPRMDFAVLSEAGYQLYNRFQKVIEELLSEEPSRTWVVVAAVGGNADAAFWRFSHGRCQKVL